MTTIKLTINGKQHELSIEQAKELHAELSKMFSVPFIVEKTVPMPYPVFPAIQPVVPYMPYEPTWTHPTITCQSRS